MSRRRIFFEFHIKILKVIFCRSKKKFVGLEITGSYLLNTPKARKKIIHHGWRKYIHFSSIFT